MTNAQFRAFVEATGHVTLAEEPPNAEDYPGALPEMLVAASVVFVPPAHRVGLDDHYRWWQFIPAPTGGIRSVRTRRSTARTIIPSCMWPRAMSMRTPHGRASALPTEAEWECAARGGLDEAEFAWGDEFTPHGLHRANTWQGEFPVAEPRAGWVRRHSPVGAFPANGYGLFDMIGNVWEWTSDWYRPRHPAEPQKACCIPENPRGGPDESSFDPAQPQLRIPRRVMKGGSHLCAPNYCRRYRPAARMAQPVDTSTSHLGFRCVTSG